MEEVVAQSRQFPESRALAQELIRRDLLTPYQVNQLFAGQGQSLRIGPYCLQQRIGEGGVGQVFKAEHTLMKRLIALKILRPEAMADPETRGRFEREIQAVGRIAHPHVVQAYDAGSAGDLCYLAMEYIQGRDLHRLVKQDGPLSVEEAADYIRQAAQGLQHIHSHGLVHRDIKPSNLILAVPESPPVAAAERDRTAAFSGVAVAKAAGVIKVLDLGLARLRQEKAGEGTRNLTGDDATTRGTLDYLAPEQAVSFHNVDIRADIYSLGCTFYFLLTGRAPFAEGAMTEILIKHQTMDPPPLHLLRPDVPTWLSLIVQRMMAKRPEDRFQTPAEVVAALPAPVTAAAESTVTDLHGRGWTDRLRALRSRSRRRLGESLRALRRLPLKVWAALAGGALLLTLAAFLAWHVWDWWATSVFQITARDGAGATTYGDGSNRDGVQGKAEIIRLREHGTPLRGLVRFDLSALKGRRNLREAVLHLTLTSARPQARTIRVYGLLDKHAAERWDEARQSWHGLPNDVTAEQHGILLGTIHVGRELAGSGEPRVTLTGPALLDFLRKDTNDVVTFGLTSPDAVAEPVELASRHHAKLPPPTLRITLR